MTNAWEALLKDYVDGVAVLRREADLERTFTTHCQRLLRSAGSSAVVLNQDQQPGKKVDVRLGSDDELALVELKLYHDEADWKETKTMKNTVESDLIFAEGKANVWVGIIDTIPSVHRQQLRFELPWTRVVLPTNVFDEFYQNANPPSGWPRERIQGAALINGGQLKTDS